MSRDKSKPYKMHIGEKHPVGFDYNVPDIPVGGNLVSATTTVSPAAGLTKSGSPVVSGSQVYQWLEAAAVGDYKVRFESIASDGKELIDDFYVRVIA